MLKQFAEWLGHITTHGARSAGALCPAIETHPTPRRS